MPGREANAIQSPIQAESHTRLGQGVMASNQVKACYDFDAQPGSGELTIKEGELLTVIRDGIDGGWMEGKNAKGKVGLFPESYVTRIASTISLPPQAAPPALPSQDFKPSYSQPPVVPTTAKPLLPPVIGGASTAFDPWADEVPPAPVLAASHPVPTGPSNSVPPSTYPTLPHVPSGNQLEDDFDDEWTEDDEENAGGRSGSAHEHRNLGTEFSATTNGRSRNTSGSKTDLSVTEDDTVSQAGNEKEKVGESLSSKSGHESREDKKDPTSQRAVARSRSAGPDSVSLSSRQGGGGAARMKNINRFSNFVKTGMEAFILNTSKMSQQPSQTFEVTISDGHIRWAPARQNYQCTVDKPKKESKLKGLKSFIAYSMTSSLTNIQVSRRYKHFDWLHEQLTNKFLLIPSPPLPEKQVAGRYEEDLIEHRKVILQLWVNKICRHPVLGQAEVWMHFMNCTDEKKWKAGKRQAEKDEYVGGNFFHCVRVPDKPLDINKVENQVETFARCCRSLDESVKVLYERINESQKRLTGPYKSNWQKSAAAFEALGQSFELDQTCGTQVTSAIRESAAVMHKIGVQHEEHGKKDMEQLLDWLYTYKGLLANIPDILNVHKSALAKLKDNERLQAENKLSPQDSEAIRQRVDVVSYSLLAEITQLNEERNDDFRSMLGLFFEQQASFYNSMGQQFSELAKRFKTAHN
uniref:Sorting nexin n=1 Tax=Bursaphelenchus xylophilus TaxID=6326 RepID=A0A1I7RHC7_BURXY